MATVYYGINRGAHTETATADTSTTGKSVEIVVNSSVVLTKQELFEAIESLEAFILQQNYPFA